jgi:hypothetical protein
MAIKSDFEHDAVAGLLQLCQNTTRDNDAGKAELGLRRNSADIELKITPSPVAKYPLLSDALRSRISILRWKYARLRQQRRPKRHLASRTRYEEECRRLTNEYELLSREIKLRYTAATRP